MKSVVFVFAALLLASLAAAGPFNCNATVTDQSKSKAYMYDLSSLYHDPNGDADHLVFKDLTGWVYVNLCGTTQANCNPSSPVCRRGATLRFNPYGDLKTQTIGLIEKDGVEPDQGVTVHYKHSITDDNYLCSDGFNSIIHVLCRQDAAEGVIKTVTDDPNDPCTITIVIYSKAGCGKEVSLPGSAGETVAIVILVLLIVGVVAYFVAGMIYNWKVKGAQSVSEMIPHRGFWCALPGLVKDGCKFIAHGCKKGDYVSV